MTGPGSPCAVERVAQADVGAGVGPASIATTTATHDDHLLVVQPLLLGINAHVNHDLPRAVVDVADEREAYARELDLLVSVLAFLITRPTFPTSLLAPSLAGSRNGIRAW